LTRSSSISPKLRGFCVRLLRTSRRRACLVLSCAHGAPGDDENADGVPDVRNERAPRCDREHEDREHLRACRHVRAALVRAHVAPHHPEHRGHFPWQSPQRHRRAVHLRACMTRRSRLAGARPGARVSWLPAPNGPFSLYIRAYWPESAILDGTWMPPTVAAAKWSRSTTDGHQVRASLLAHPRRDRGSASRRWLPRRTA
jgi:hypothetical protein